MPNGYLIEDEINKIKNRYKTKKIGDDDKMDEHKKIIEINGVKMEVDLREVKVVDSYKVGDNVKVLIKDYSTYKSYPGVIVGFDQFKELPTIIIAYVKIEYSEAEINFVYLNSQSKDVEICPSNKHDIGFNESQVIEMFDKEIETTEKKLREVKMKRNYFITNFNKHFKEEGE
jgi:hypothetical protein